MKIKKEELSVFKFTNELTEELKTQLDKDLDCLISCKRHLMDLAEKERNKKNKKMTLALISFLILSKILDTQ